VSVRKHTAYNLLGSIVPLLVSLFTIPVYLSLVGPARYGVLTIAWLLLGYFGLFDLGLGRATAQRIAALCDATAGERARTFWTAFVLNVALGVVGALLIWPIAAYFFGSVFKIDEGLRLEMQAAVPWLILTVPMATLSGVLSGALQGRQRFLELNLISVIGTVLFQLLPLGAAVLFGSDLGVLVPATLLARLITLIMLFESCRRHVFQGHAATFSYSQAGQLLRFGGWVTVTSFVGPMMVILDRFIISAMSGAKVVTYYTVPFQLAERTTMISAALSSALFPRFASATRQEESRLAREALHTIMVVVTPLIVLSILLIKPFLSWWITKEFAEEAAGVGQIVLIGFWINSFARIPSAMLQARQRPDLVAKCHLAELLPYFFMLYIGLSTIGTMGAAVAFSLRALVDFVLLSVLAGVSRISIQGVLAPVALLGLALVIATQESPEQPLWVFLAVVNLLISIVWAWWKAPTSLRELALIRLGF